MFYVVTISSVHSACTYWIHIMLLNMKVQFNSCFYMRTRLSVEFLIKMMLFTRRPYIVVLYMRDLMLRLFVRRWRINWSFEKMCFSTEPTAQRTWVNAAHYTFWRYVTMLPCAKMTDGLQQGSATRAGSYWIDPSDMVAELQRLTATGKVVTTLSMFMRVRVVFPAILINDIYYN